MLVAVSMGCEQPRRSVLSRRRSILRLRRFSCRFIVAFTRNPLWLGCMEKRAILQTPQKGQGFSSFSLNSNFRAAEGSLIQGLVLQRHRGVDPCRLVRQVNQFCGYEQSVATLAAELLHLPDEPAGVGEKRARIL